MNSFEILQAMNEIPNSPQGSCWAMTVKNRRSASMRPNESG